MTRTLCAVLLISLTMSCRPDGKAISKLADDAINPLPAPSCSDVDRSTEIQNLGFLCDAQAEPGLDLVRLCVDQLLVTFQGMDEPCQHRYRPEVQRLAENLITRMGQSLTNQSTTSLDEARLKNFLGAIKYFYQILGPRVYRDFADRELNLSLYEGERLFETALQKISKNLWSSINKSIDTDAATEPFRSKSLDNAADVVTAAFAEDGFPVEVVVRLLVDAMMPINERVDILIELSDFGRQLNLPVDTNDLPVKNLISLSANLGYPEGLSDAVATSQGLPNGIIRLFRQVAENHATITAFIGAPMVPGQGELPGLGPQYRQKINSLPLEEVPEHLRAFVSHVRRQKLLLSNFEQSGYFSGRDNNLLDSGLDTGILQSVKSRNQAISNDVKSTLLEYDQARSALLSSIRQRVSQDIASVEQSYGLKTANLQLNSLMQELESVRQSLTSRKGNIAKYQQQISSAVGVDEVALFETRLESEGTVTFSASSTNAKFSGEVDDPNISDLAFRTLDLNANEYYSFNVTGNWAPTCALRKDPHLSSFADETIQVGPSGFSLVSSQGQSHIESSDLTHRETQYTDTNLSASVCAGVGFSYGVSVKAQACVNATVGKRRERSESTTSSDARRTSRDASFQSGLRLQSTPFPKLPAGSLLAFIMEPDETNPFLAQKIEVVNRNSVLFTPTAAKIYLVVNDCESSNGSQTSLTVQATKIATAHPSAEATLKAVLGFLKDAEEKTEAAIKAGTFAPRILQNLRSQWVADLTANGTVDTAFLNVPALKQLFEYWIDSAVLQAEAKAQIIRLEREIEAISYQMERYEHAQTNTDLAKELLEIQIHHAANNADLYLLVGAMKRVLFHTRTRLLPLIRLHYPKILTEISSSDHSWLSAGLETPIPQLLEGVSHTIDEINNRLADDYAIQFNQDQTLYTMLRFPRPDLVASVDNTLLPVADFARSQAMWQALVTGNNDSAGMPLRTQVEVTARDIYRPDLPLGRLTCQQVKPVISDMMVVFAANPLDYTQSQIEFWNDGQLSFNADFGRYLTFPTSAGPEHFQLTETSIGAKALAIGFVTNDNLVEAQQLLQNKSYANNSGLGMSPIATLNFTDLAGIRSVFDYTPGCANCLDPATFTDIIVAFKLEVTTVSSNQRIKWIQNCEDQP